MKPDDHPTASKWDIPPERIALKVKDAAYAVGRTPSYLYQEQRAGRLKFCRPNRPNADYLVMIDDLKAWVRGETNGPA